ncbi:hypothetical protein BDN71DRAFT_1505928 [Pleurotus eryngii]|uniref:Uncharacterized protein n=1 Tax=Pleurotus eryngii TaxID=5323 RepID=A0A9P5ZZC2_PLEER|nr:hypothetical protein BDN71DRAFT_1505928 [Pleurotus eryngii]
MASSVWGRGGRSGGMRRTDAETLPPGWLEHKCHGSPIAPYHTASLSGTYFIRDSTDSLLLIQDQLLGVQLPSPIAYAQPHCRLPDFPAVHSRVKASARYLPDDTLDPRVSA